MDYFNIVSWLVNIVPWLGVPLLATLLFLITRKQLRALALATLLIAVPLSIMLASNNNQANAIRNFFMGILLFAVPLLFHAWAVSFMKQKQI